ncbi:MAG: 4Fe-4S dicluster domain-containing protein [Chloroflexi bacterium]|nr:4Fe-4S dicluster domain-containing protein [Chloroflexota bacterium]
MKTVFVNPERCIGCRHCEVACAIEHSQTREVLTVFFEDPLPQPRIHVEPGIDFTTFPNKCRHCNPAPCMQACPTGALYRDGTTGSVLLDGYKCIACSMCAIVCPFDVITFHKTWNVKVEHEINFKCDHCVERQARGEVPACVEACKTDALIFGEINELTKQGRQDFTLRLTSNAGRVDETPSLPASVKMSRDMNAKLSKFSPLE